MSDITEYKNGDTVRVVLEGKVVDLYSDGQDFPVFDIEADPSQHCGLFIDTSNDTVKSVEVLASPLKVGDLVEGEQYALLPVGTVVYGKYGALWKLDNGFWSNVQGQQWADAGLTLPRAIKYLPE